MSGEKRKRVTVKLQRPNPLFEQWLTEWRDKAKENDSKMQYCFSIALASLKKYPLPLESGQDCKILKGFGSKLCDMLDKKLHSHKLNPISDKIQTVNVIDKQVENQPKRRRKSDIVKDGEYIPKHDSGGYAILISLFKQSQEENFKGFLTKAEIVKLAQQFTSSSFTKPDPGTRYTAWSSMKTLLSKSLISKTGNPAKFSLTEEGKTLAEKLNCFESNNKPESEFVHVESQKEVVKNKATKLNKLETEENKSKPMTSSKPEDESFILAPNQFKIILYVDTQETCGKNNIDEDPLLFELQRLSVLYEVRDLKVGDFAWICRDKYSNKEVVLPYVIERKRMDDFASSIKDGRYYEQKFRLKSSGIQYLTYMIESYGKNDTHLGLPLPTLFQAATNTAIQDGFSVKFTEHLRGSVEYLACFTNLLIKNFRMKTIISCLKSNLPQLDLNDDLVHLMTFKEFNTASVKQKNPTVKETFVKMLIQVKGVSVDQALAIVEKYDTPLKLYKTYETLGSAGEALLANITYGDKKKCIGKVLSKTIFLLFTSNFN